MKDQILSSIREHIKQQLPGDLRAGIDYLPVSGKVIDEHDVASICESAMDMWFTTGRFAHDFEKEFAKVMEQEFCLLVNSGSSANLVAFATLTSPDLGDKALKPGDEVITVAAGFPTTVNPIFQHGCLPVFIDVIQDSYEPNYDEMIKAIGPKTKAIMIAHTLGNPYDSKRVREICDKHNLWFIEDCCDAVGAKVHGKSVGTYSHLSTVSFYPAHHLTMGEGGAVLTSDRKLKKIAESFRDWGRDCWCPTGKDNTCGKRFNQDFADLPHGYDHKYVYRHIGYNLKISDMQAALGLSQLKKLNSFIDIRNKNFLILKERLKDHEEVLSFAKTHEGLSPSWFGFPIRLTKKAKFKRQDIIKYLESKKIGTRLLFGGNLLKQPLYKNSNYRVVSSLSVTDDIMENVFWIGVYPKLHEDHLNYMAQTISDFLGEHA